jgi:hypothetical protein
MEAAKRRRWPVSLPWPGLFHPDADVSADCGWHRLPAAYFRWDEYLKPDRELPTTSSVRHGPAGLVRAVLAAWREGGLREAVFIPRLEHAQHIDRPDHGSAPRQLIRRKFVTANGCKLCLPTCNRAPPWSKTGSLNPPGIPGLGCNAVRFLPLRPLSEGCARFLAVSRSALDHHRSGRNVAGT